MSAAAVFVEFENNSRGKTTVKRHAIVLLLGWFSNNPLAFEIFCKCNFPNISQAFTGCLLRSQNFPHFVHSKIEKAILLFQIPGYKL